MTAFDDNNFTMQVIALLFALPLICTLGLVGLAAIWRIKDRPRAAWCLLGAVCLWSAEPFGVNRVFDLAMSVGVIDPAFYSALIVISLAVGSLLTFSGWLLALYPLAIAEPVEAMSHNPHPEEQREEA